MSILVKKCALDYWRILHIRDKQAIILLVHVVHIWSLRFTGKGSDICPEKAGKNYYTKPIATPGKKY